MKRKIKRIVVNLILVISLICFASWVFKISTGNFLADCLLGWLVFSIYVGLLSYWALAVFKRIMHDEIRRYLVYTSCLLIFWVLLRTARIYLFFDGRVSRILEYWYYVPQIFLFYCFYIVSLVMTDKKYNVKAGKSVAFCTSALLSVAIVSNEHHQLFFKVNLLTGERSYAFGFYLVVLWLFMVVVIALTQLPRDKGERKHDYRLAAPYLIVASGVGFVALSYYFDITGKEGFFEYMAFFTLLVIGFWESLIQTGLLPSNMDYDWCFNHSTVKARVIDKKHRTVFLSKNATELSPDIVNRLIKDGSESLDEDTELIIAPINGGYVAWEKDISEENRTLTALTEAKEFITEATESLEESIAVEKKQLSIKARSRLYDITFSNVETELNKLSSLLVAAKYAEEDDLSKILTKIDLMGVYVKRKSNLLLLSEQTIPDFSGELNLCFKESFDNLKDAGIVCSYYFSKIEDVNYDAADLLYKAFEVVLEEVLDNLKEINVILSGVNNAFVLTVNTVLNSAVRSEAFLQEIRNTEGVFVETETTDENDYTVSFYVRKGAGDANL